MMNTCCHPDGCPRPVRAYGWCRPHWTRILKTGNAGPADIASRQPAGRPCKYGDCTNPVGHDGGFGWCGMHYQRWNKYGDPTITKKGGASLPGPLNPNWSGTEASYTAVHLRLRQAVRGHDDSGGASRFFLTVDDEDDDGAA